MCEKLLSLSAWEVFLKKAECISRQLSRIQEKVSLTEGNNKKKGKLSDFEELRANNRLRARKYAAK